MTRDPLVGYSPSSAAETLDHFRDAVDRLAELDGHANEAVEFWYAYIVAARNALMSYQPEAGE